MIDDTELSHDERAVIDALARVPAPMPPAGLASAFHDRLQAEVAPIAARRRARWPLALVATLAILSAGGWWMERSARQRTVTALRAELTLALKDLSDAKRFQAITVVEKSGVRDSTIVASLTTAMLTDPNANVRVAAVEALAEVGDPKSVFNAATKALENERSPFVFAAMLTASDRLRPADREAFLRALVAHPSLLPTIRAEAQARIAS